MNQSADSGCLQVVIFDSATLYPERVGFIEIVLQRYRSRSQLQPSPEGAEFSFYLLFL
jgi:hypothetical protein